MFSKRLSNLFRISSWLRRKGNPEAQGTPASNIERGDSWWNDLREQIADLSWRQLLVESAIFISAVLLCPGLLSALVAITAALCHSTPLIVLISTAVMGPIFVILGVTDWVRYQMRKYRLREWNPRRQFLRALWCIHLILVVVFATASLLLVALAPQLLSMAGIITACGSGIVFVRLTLLDDWFPTRFALQSRLRPEPPSHQPTPPPPSPHLRVLRGRILEQLADVQQQVQRDEPTVAGSLPWGGVLLPRSVATLHFAAIGATGSGKSVTHTLLMEKALVGHQSGLVRGLVYDAKRDVVPVLARIGDTPDIAILNPFDARSLAWDLARDITDEKTARQVAETLIPHGGHESQPFFNNAARDLVSGAIASLQNLAPQAWTLRDLIHVASDTKTLRSVLMATPATTHYVSDYFEPETTFQNIRSAIATHLAPYRSIAAAWHRTAEEGRMFTLDDWMKNPRVLVLGEDESTRAALAAVNRLIFTRATELLLNQPERTGVETWVFLDEVRDLGRLDILNRLLLKGRSKNVCVVLGFQDIEGLREEYGDKVANEIVGQCGHYAFLKLNSPTTAEWASQAIGEQEVFETIAGSAMLSNERPSSKQVKIRRVVLATQLMNIDPPKGLDQLTGYYLTAKYGLYRSTLSRHEIGHVDSLRDEQVADFVPCPASHQVLAPWDDSDRTRLCLAAGPKATSSTPKSPRTAADVPDEYKIQVIPRPVDPPSPTAKPQNGSGSHKRGTDPMDIPRIHIKRKKT